MAEDGMVRVPKKVTVQVFDAKAKAKHACYVTMACGSSKFKTAEVKPSGDKLTWNEEAQLQVGSSATDVVLKVKTKSGSFGGGNTIGSLSLPLKDLPHTKSVKKYRDLDKGGQLSCVVWVSESEIGKETSLSRKKSFLGIKNTTSMRKQSSTTDVTKDSSSTSAVSANGSTVAVGNAAPSVENTPKGFTDTPSIQNERSNSSIPGTVGPALVMVHSPGGSDVHGRNNSSLSSITKSLSKVAVTPIKFVASPVVAAGGAIRHGAQSLSFKISGNNASATGISTNSNDTLTFPPSEIPLSHAVEAAISYAKEKEPELATRQPFVEGQAYVHRHDSLASLDDSAAGQATSIAEENIPSDINEQASDMQDGPSEAVDDVPIEDLERELEGLQARNKELVTKRDKLTAYIDDLHWRVRETGNDKLIPAF